MILLRLYTVPARPVIRCACSLILASALAGCGNSGEMTRQRAYHVDGPGIQGECCLRSSVDSNAGLLLMITPTGPSYPLDEVPGEIATRPGSSYFRLDAARRTLVGSSSSEWGSSAERATDCSTQIGPFPDSFRAPADKHTLTYHKQPVATAGRYVMSTDCSPSQRFLAVVSTDGPLTTGWLWQGSGGSASAHYLEFFAYSDGRRLGKPLPLPFTSSEALYSGCWTPDEAYILFSDPMMFHLYVVATPVKHQDPTP